MAKKPQKTPVIHRKAYAKVNLFLNVKGKRPDGYHDLEMINARIGLADDLAFTPEGERLVTIRSNDRYLENHDNLVYHIARRLMETYAPSEHVTIDIDKRIPVGAGLGSNSADAAAVIEGLDELFQWNLPRKTMAEIAVLFGSDIPYCLETRPSLVEGIGEKITPLDLDLSNYGVILVQPKVFVATEQVFKKGDEIGFVTHDIGPVVEAIRQKNVEKMINLLRNGLEEITFSLSPKVKEAKALLVNTTGPRGVIMTGSGSTVIKIINMESFSIPDQLMSFSDKFSLNIYRFS
jgi:4-diphosphocytidyl-2-C-methyl-D-erythritol kinase